MALVVAIQEFASVTVNVYVPGAKFDKSSVVPTTLVPSLHEKLYAVVPPVTVTAIEPLSSPLQVELTEVFDALKTVGSVIVWLTVAVQLSASLIVTVYVAAARLVKV